jgi:hypothetical protein
MKNILDLREYSDFNSNLISMIEQLDNLSNSDKIILLSYLAKDVSHAEICEVEIKLNLKWCGSNDQQISYRMGSLVESSNN